MSDDHRFVGLRDEGDGVSVWSLASGDAEANQLLGRAYRKAFEVPERV